MQKIISVFIFLLLSTFVYNCGDQKKPEKKPVAKKVVKEEPVEKFEEPKEEPVEVAREPKPVEKETFIKAKKFKHRPQMIWAGDHWEKAY